MPAIERGDTSNCTDPILDVKHKIDGILTDLYQLKYIIFEDVTNPGTPVQVYPPTGEADVDLSDCPVGHRLSIGRYVAEWACPVDEVVGNHIIRWLWKTTASSPERQWEKVFSVVLPGAVSAVWGYCTVQDIRDEGVTATVMSDERAENLIRDASLYIEKVTGRWFEARDRTFRVRGKGSRVLHLPHPIIQIDSVNLITGRGSNATRDEIDVDDVIVFNRHLTEDLRNPDDRDNPKIEFTNTWGFDYPRRDDSIFPDYSQVVEVAGTFGYTELEPDTTPGETSDASQIPNSQGVTPYLITKVCKLLVIRELGLMGDKATRDDWLDEWRVTEEKTVDQSYKKSGLNELMMTGAWTGDPEIDGILAQFVSPPGVSSV